MLAIAPICLAEPPEKLLAGLKSEEFQVREKAQDELLDWARQDVEKRKLQIYDQARNAEDPEVRQRSHNVLRALAMDVYLQEGEGFLGIQMLAVRAEVPTLDGVEDREVVGITRVLRGTPARDADLRVGDMILSINGEKLSPLNAIESFQNAIRQIKPGTLTMLEVLRNDEVMEVEITLGRRPPEQNPRFFGNRLENMNELAQRDQERFFQQWLEKLDN